MTLLAQQRKAIATEVSEQQASAEAAGVDAVVAGKPEAPMAALIVDDVLGGAADRALMVGDRPETDGLFAARLGCPYAQVRSGVVAPGERVPPGVAVALDVADLAAVARSLIN